MILIFFFSKTFTFLFLQENEDIQQAYMQNHECKESFEEVPLITACLTYLGFYLLMILGYINQLFFAPKVAKEVHRDVSTDNDSFTVSR